MSPGGRLHAVDDAHVGNLWLRFAAHDPTRFIKDVIIRPSVGPSAAWVVVSLLGLLFWLTITYASNLVPESIPNEFDSAERAIPVWAGFGAIGVVSAIAIVIGLEPILSEPIGRLIGRLGHALRIKPSHISRQGFRDFSPHEWVSEHFQWIFTRTLIIVFSLLKYIARLIWRAPSLILSGIDWFLARPVALLAGVTLRPFYLRYGWLFAVLILASYFSWRLQAPGGLISAIVGLTVILAIVRRWNWIEQDRLTFLAARKSDRSIEKIGFSEDLRDEALVSLVFVFVLFPLMLRQVELAYDAFTIDAASLASLGTFEEILLWTSFFGAELAKAAPLFDWAEVFDVASESPITVKTVRGAQVLFSMRVMLDILIIAAIVQSIQIASHIREQSQAFWSYRLPILDPFIERKILRKLWRELQRHPQVKPHRHSEVTSFPSYEYDRTIQIAFGVSRSNIEQSKSIRDPAVRQAALALLAVQHPNDSTNRMLAQLIRNSDNDEILATAMSLIAEVPGEHTERALTFLASDRSRPNELRLEAIRQIGRLRITSASSELMKILNDNNSSYIVHVQAGLSLAKMGEDGAALKLRQLADIAGSTQSVMSISYALALTSNSQESDIVTLFDKSYEKYVLRAYNSAKGIHDVTKKIPEGSFWMGSSQEDARSLPSELPRHEVGVPKFQIGVYPVTIEEYDIFLDAVGETPPARDLFGSGPRNPAYEVSWHQALAYCDWLRLWTGENWRLPSEAEWEYACRAGRVTVYSFGDDISCIDKYAYYKGNAGDRTSSVGTKLPNDFGLYDMHGNVWEWCQDVWNANYALPRRPDDGSPWLKGNYDYRVLRGGSFASASDRLRSASRVGMEPTRQDDGVGVRLARDVSPV